MIRVALNHKSTYLYDRAINLGPQVVRLRPAAHARTNICSYSLGIAPQDHFLNWQQDPHGNYLARLLFEEKTEKLEVEVDLIGFIRPEKKFASTEALRTQVEADFEIARQLLGSR